MSQHSRLSRRERQIMEVLFRKGRASVAEILAEISEPPGYSGLRCTVNVLERKGCISHMRQGKKYVYSPTTPRRNALREALRQLLRTYFEDSPAEALSAIVALHRKDLSPADIQRLEKLIHTRSRGSPQK